MSEIDDATSAEAIRWAIVEIESLATFRRLVLKVKDDALKVAKEKLEADAAEIARLTQELDKWRPLTPEEAQKAYDEAEAYPMSEEQIERILDAALDPAEPVSNQDMAQMAAKVRSLTQENADLRDLYRLGISRDSGIPWPEVPQSAVDGALAGMRELKAFKAEVFDAKERKDGGT